MPTAVGVNVGDVAVDEPAVARLSGAEPTVVPDPVGQSAAADPGPQTVKATWPVGGPTVGVPVTVAVSVTVPPSGMLPGPVGDADCWVDRVVGEAGGDGGADGGAVATTICSSVPPQAVVTASLLASPG